MSAKDLFHDAVKHALQKEQWKITHDPLNLEWEEVNVKIDLGAERLIAAERAHRKIAVEIKSFISPSAISDFHTALGQFLNYRIMLDANQSDHELYLAVPADAYSSFFQTRLAQTAIQKNQLRLLVYDPLREEIIQWTK